MEATLAAKTNIEYWEEVLKNSPPAYRAWFADEKNILQRI